jgi:hypothetical protein
MTPQPENPEDIAAVSAVAELLWEMDRLNRPNVADSFSQAREAQTTHRYENVALELWHRGWLDELAIVNSAGGANSA